MERVDIGSESALNRRGLTVPVSAESGRFGADSVPKPTRAAPVPRESGLLCADSLTERAQFGSPRSTTPSPWSGRTSMLEMSARSIAVDAVSRAVAPGTALQLDTSLAAPLRSVTQRA